MIKAEDIKQGNIIKIGDKSYQVDINTSTGEIKLIGLPVIEHVEIEVIVVD